MPFILSSLNIVLISFHALLTLQKLCRSSLHGVSTLLLDQLPFQCTQSAPPLSVRLQAHGTLLNSAVAYWAASTPLEQGAAESTQGVEGDPAALIGKLQVRQRVFVTPGKGIAIAANCHLTFCCITKDNRVGSSCGAQDTNL